MLKILSLFSTVFIGPPPPSAGEAERAVGYAEIPFNDPHFEIERTLSVWYGVEDGEKGVASPIPWDVFQVSSAAPEEGEKQPIVILSHGNGGNPHQLSWLTKELIRNGFLVIGVKHLDWIDGKPHINHWMRARDVGVMIDQLAKSRFAANADLERVGIAGFSLGGTAAVWVAGGQSTRLDRLVPGAESVAHPDEFVRVQEAAATLDKEMMAHDWKDPRIKAAFLLAPAWGWVFDQEGLAKINVPVSIVAPENDGLLITAGNAGVFAKGIPNASYRQIPGEARHCIFLSKPNEERLGEIPASVLPLLNDGPSVDRTGVQNEVAAEAVDFFKLHV